MPSQVLFCLPKLRLQAAVKRAFVLRVLRERRGVSYDGVREQENQLGKERRPVHQVRGKEKQPVHHTHTVSW